MRGTVNRRGGFPGYDFHLMRGGFRLGGSSMKACFGASAQLLQERHDETRTNAREVTSGDAKARKLLTRRRTTKSNRAASVIGGYLVWRGVGRGSLGGRQEQGARPFAAGDDAAGDSPRKEPEMGAIGIN